MHTEPLALFGGQPVRKQRLPYGRQTIDREDIAKVVEVLESGWITTGPTVTEFEKEFSKVVNVADSVCVTSGTAALHVAMMAIDIRSGDEVIVPTMTFAASANAAVFQGATPVFVDVDPETLLIDTKKVKQAITPRTRAIVSVDYAGHACDYDALRQICKGNNLTLIADACHALGGTYKNQAVGSLADITIFSFHPVKHITTGEGGMASTHRADLAKRMRMFRNHGIATDFREREKTGSWFYEMVELGYNYRLTDIQCALGLSQLKKLPNWIERRREIAEYYSDQFKNLEGIKILKKRPEVEHAYHLYVVRFDLNVLRATRQEIFKALVSEGIGVNVHYIPVHLHPFYRNRYGTKKGDCPIAEAAYEEMISLPMFSGMNEEDCHDVVKAVRKVIAHFASSQSSPSCKL